MRKLNEAMMTPSALDSRANYCGSVPEDEWLQLLARTRDSGCLTESNWRMALKRLGGAGEDVQIFRCGHWACGWVEWLAVKATAIAAAEEIEKKLADYPILDEDDFSDLVQEEADRVWKDCFDVKDRLKYMRDFHDQFEFRSYADIRAQIRGQYFGGYEGELLA